MEVILFRLNASSQKCRVKEYQSKAFAPQFGSSGRRGLQTAEAPEFERYGETIDGMTGNGGAEIWIPIKG
jgi:predicted transcriptional regulator YdeE